MADLIFNNFTTDRKYNGIFFKKILEVGAKEAGLEYKKLELSVNLVGEGRIKALNKKYRDKNRATDVLSFPLQEKKDAKTRNDDIISLGDIFICLPVAKKYAVRESVSLDYKLAFLAIHTAEKDKMFSLQNKVINKIEL
ncbi:MAG: rRNA maturation RNase YbeY [Candidatus Yanofskybacteria bacterium]|nr:rRNA maturation RNase YbeY [Candidatus Yanofskybacteria bacterium]